MPRATGSSAEVLERTRRASRRSSSGPSFAAPTRSSSRRRASARGGDAEEAAAAVYRRSLSERSMTGHGSPSTPAAASRRKLRHSHSDLSRSSPTLDVPDSERRRAEEAFLAQREGTLKHKRRAEEAARRASPTQHVPDDERERAEAEFLAARERALNDRKRSEKLAASRSPSSPNAVSISPRASATASPAVSVGPSSPRADDRRCDAVTEEDFELVGVNEELLLPHDSLQAGDHVTSSDEAFCEQVLLAYYGHFEPSFATREKVQKIVKTFRARSEKLGEPELFREKMFGAIAAQRDVHPLEFFEAQQEASAHQKASAQKQGREQDPVPDQTPTKQQKKKRGFRGRLGFKSKKEDRKSTCTQRAVALSPAVDIDGASPFSPRKSLSRTPPSSPPTCDESSCTSPLVPVKFDSRRPDAAIKSPKVESTTGGRTIDRETAAVRIQAACRGYQLRAAIERIASSPGKDSRSSVNTELRQKSEKPVSIGQHHDGSTGSESSPLQEPDDVSLLMDFYSKVEPAFANKQKVERIIERFRGQSTGPGESWRDLMYSAITKQRGIDPRDTRVLNSIILDAEATTAESASIETGSPGERSPAPSSVYAWNEQRSAVALDLESVALASAQSRLWLARVLQSMASSHITLAGRLTPISIIVANALSMAVVARAAQCLSSESRREILSLREMKRIDSSTRSASSKRPQHYDDIEAAKVMRQVRYEVGVLTKEMSANHQQIKKVSLQQIFESLGRTGDVRKRLQSRCAAALESSALLEQMRLEKRFNWGLNDGDCVALMEHLLVRVEKVKQENEAAQLSRRESAMMGSQRAASIGKGMYELQRDTAVRCHPGCLSNWVGAVATGERVRVVKVVSDKSGMLFAKVDEDGLLGWIALGARPGDDDKPVMKRVTQSQVGLTTPPSRASSVDESPSARSRESTKKQGSREPQDESWSSETSSPCVVSSDDRRVDASTGKAHSHLSASSPALQSDSSAVPQPGNAVSGERWARESTQAQRLATLRHELGRDPTVSPGTRSLEDKLHALEAQLGTLTSDLKSDNIVGQRRNRDTMRASWSPNATSGAQHTALDGADLTRRGHQSNAVSPVGTKGVRCIQNSWDTQDVADWLVSVGLGEYAAGFSANSMDGEAMCELERWRQRAYNGAQIGNDGSLFADCLRRLGLAKTGHVLKFCRYLAESAGEVPRDCT